VQVHLHYSLQAVDTCLMKGQEYVRLNVSKGIWSTYCFETSHMRNVRTD